MSIEDNKSLIRRFMEAANTGDDAALNQIVAHGFTARTQAGDLEFGRDALIGVFSQRLRAVPDFRSTLVDLIAEADRVVVLGRDTGTPVGEYMGITPTGKSFDVTWVDTYRIRNGQIVEMSMDAMRRQVAD